MDELNIGVGDAEDARGPMTGGGVVVAPREARGPHSLSYLSVPDNLNVTLGSASGQTLI